MTAEAVTSTIFDWLFLISVFVWLLLLNRYRTRGELLPSEPHRLVPWKGFPHVALAFFIYVALPLFWLFILQRSLDITSDTDLSQSAQFVTYLLAGDSLLKLACVALVITFLKIDLGSSLVDLGIRVRKIPTDLLLGLVASVATVPIILFMQRQLKELTKQFFDEKAAHPLEKILHEESSTGVVFWAVFTAVLAAPIVEEFLFRVVLQGWLEKAFYRTRLLLDAELANATTGQDRSLAAPASPPFMWQPIVLSSITFALLHAGYGPEPVPIFCFAMVMGYLYAKTHRILPGIVVHMALNGLSMYILLSHI